MLGTPEPSPNRNALMRVIRKLLLIIAVTLVSTAAMPSLGADGLAP